MILQLVPRTAGMLAKAAVRSPGERRNIEDLNGEGTLPVATLLCRPAPNPFNPQTNLHFTLAQDGQVDLAIYSLRGEPVRSLLSQPMAAGAHAVTWDGRDDAGHAVPSGVYVARMISGPVTSVQRLTLVR